MKFTIFCPKKTQKDKIPKELNLSLVVGIFFGFGFLGLGFNYNTSISTVLTNKILKVMGFIRTDSMEVTSVKIVQPSAIPVINFQIFI